MGLLTRQPESYVKKKQYVFHKTLGEGSFGIVRSATWNGIEPPVGVAVKVISKKILKGNEAVVMGEMDVLKDLDHPNVIKLLDWFESKDKFYLTFEEATGGELFDRIISRGRFSEADAAKTISSVASALKYLHDHNVVHRDIKPENILYRTRAEDANVVLVDFGIARHLDSDDEVLTNVCGSFGYAAPEILAKKGHGKAVDMWSLGVITYTMLCGYSPFRSDNPATLAAETQRGKIEFHDRYWKNVTMDAKDFVKRCLTVTPSQRITAAEALQHPWLVEYKNAAQEAHDISLGLRENYRKRWKSAINAVRASNKLRTFAALAAAANAENAAKEAGGVAGEDKAAAPASVPPGKMLDGDITPPTRAELYSEDEDGGGGDDDDDAGYHTGEEDGGGGAGDAKRGKDAPPPGKKQADDKEEQVAKQGTATSHTWDRVTETLGHLGLGGGRPGA